MEDRMIIGLFGVEIESVNFGVSALAYTQLQMLHRIEEELGYELEYWIFSDDSEECIEETKKLLGIKYLERKYLVRIRTGLSGLKRLRKDIDRCSFIIDLTYGDSFSDIYGFKNFLLYSIPKLMTIRQRKNLILGPQTYGPFYKKLVYSIGTYILKKADYVVARDELSLNYAVQTALREDTLLTSDLAMNLPCQKKKEERAGLEQLNIGLNVSLLMWEKNAENSRIGVNLDYHKLVRNLITKLGDQEAKVHLIVHEYTKGEHTEYRLAEELHEEFKTTILAPPFKTPIEAKNYMARLDLFIGSRMHATIGAFSAGVPVIPVSYSRKFEGLYSSLGYDHCIDCSREDEDSAIEKILDKVEGRSLLREDLHSSLKEALERNEAYYRLLKRLIVEAGNEDRII